VVITGATSGIGCAESPVVTQRPDDFRAVAQYALDPDNAARLWDLCAADMARL
jgi:NADP-dependent 3-hydroxy acid dehydrogenase YdfG